MKTKKHNSFHRTGKSLVEQYGRVKAKKTLLKMRNGWDKEKVINAYLKIPRFIKKDWKKHYEKGKLCSPSTVITIFGNFNNFEKEAGKKFKKYKHTNKIIWTKEKIIKTYLDIPKQITTREWHQLAKKKVLPGYGVVTKNFGTMKNFAKIAGKPFLRGISDKWEKIEIIKAYKKCPPMKKSEWNEYRKKGLLPDATIVRDRFGNFDTLEELAEKEFLPRLKSDGNKFGRKGKNEELILDKIEEESNFKIKRQYRIGNRYLDGYISELNIAVEVDEQHHNSSTQRIKDKLREKEILKINPGIKFIRINEQEYLRNKNQRNLGEFNI